MKHLSTLLFAISIASPLSAVAEPDVDPAQIRSDLLAGEYKSVTDTLYSLAQAYYDGETDAAQVNAAFAIFETTHPQMETAINAWVRDGNAFDHISDDIEQTRAHDLAILALVQQTVHTASAVRGTSLFRDVFPGDARRFSAMMEDAEANFTSVAANWDRLPPVVYTGLKIDVLGTRSDGTGSWLANNMVEFDPHPDVIREAAFVHAPKWGGDATEGFATCQRLAPLALGDYDYDETTCKVTFVYDAGLKGKHLEWAQRVLDNTPPHAYPWARMIDAIYYRRDPMKALEAAHHADNIKSHHLENFIFDIGRWRGRTFEPDPRAQALWLEFAERRLGELEKAVELDPRNPDLALEYARHKMREPAFLIAEANKDKATIAASLPANRARVYEVLTRAAELGTRRADLQDALAGALHYGYATEGGMTVSLKPDYEAYTKAYDHLMRAIAYERFTPDAIDGRASEMGVIAWNTNKLMSEGALSAVTTEPQLCMEVRRQRADEYICDRLSDEFPIACGEERRQWRRPRDGQALFENANICQVVRDADIQTLFEQWPGVSTE